MVSSVLLTAALVSGAVAAPSSLSGHRKAGFSVPQVRANNYIRHGPSAMAKTLLKFGKTVPDDLAATIKAFKAERKALMMEKRDNGSAVTTPEEYDTEYLTPVSIGTPAQLLNLDFDSGSSDLWVFSSLTTSSDVSGQAIYTPSDSSTSAEIDGATWDISYGDGSSSSGSVYTDVVSVGGVSYASQAVETAETVSESFTSDSNNDGLLGLGFSTLNTVTPTAQLTFFDNIRSTLDQSLWTVDLKAGEPGTYNFGWIDDSLYTGDISYTDVDSSLGYWTFTADSYSVGTASSDTGSSSGTATTSAAATPTSSSGPGSGSGSGSGGHGSGGHGGSGSSRDASPGFFRRANKKHSSSSTSSSSSSAGKASGSGSSTAAATTLTGIADTGTTLALLPESVCEEYYAQVSGAEYSNSIGGYVFSCDADLPTFSYVVGDVTITIPSDYLNYAPVDTAETQCYGGIQPDTDIGFSIFGDVALKAAFVVFSDDGSGSPQLGFATKDL